MTANEENLYRHVEFLTTLRPYRNYQNRESLDKVCEYLTKELAQPGLSVTEQPFKAQGKEYRNIIAHYNQNKTKRLIVGAHYDVCGDQPGADDNASAVAGLLESARLTAAYAPDLEYGIEFVAYCLEEPPFYGSSDMGSYRHAESIAKDKENILGVINYEMIGYFHDGPQPYPIPELKAHYPETADFVAVVGIKAHHDFNHRVLELMREGAGIDVQMIDDPCVKDLAGMSDQRSYWPFGIPALMINDTSFLRNPNYHQVSDDIDTLNFDSMSKVVKATYNAIVGM